MYASVYDFLLYSAALGCPLLRMELSFLKFSGVMFYPGGLLSQFFYLLWIL